MRLKRSESYKICLLNDEGVVNFEKILRFFSVNGIRLVSDYDLSWEVPVYVIFQNSEAKVVNKLEFEKSTAQEITLEQFEGASEKVIDEITDRMENLGECPVGTDAYAALSVIRSAIAVAEAPGVVTDERKVVEQIKDIAAVSLLFLRNYEEN